MSTLVALSTPGVLVAEHAAGYERLRAHARREDIATGTTNALQAMRTYTQQVALWHDYMTPSWAASNKVAAQAKRWNGVVYYRRPGKPSVAIPGTSNHGDGDTVDWQNLGGYTSGTWARFAALAAEHGWNNREGRSVGEPWHWTRVAAADRHRNDATPTPAPQEPERELEDDGMRYYKAKGTRGFIFDGWTFEQGPDGMLRALDARESNAVAVEGRTVHAWSADDLYDFALRYGLWQFTGTQAQGDPLGLTGAIIGRNATSVVKGGSDGVHWPPAQAR